MRLSEHFTLAELTRSDAAARIGDDNQPPPEHLKNLTALAGRLEAVRALFGRPVTIASCYRNPVVNAHVGGVSGSDHAQGHAADIHVPPFSDLEVARKIRDSGLRFDQLILEGTPARPRCVHISFAPRMRGQVLRQPGGPGTQFFHGLEEA